VTKLRDIDNGIRGLLRGFGLKMDGLKKPSQVHALVVG
jgi:hypothetical protein